MHMPGQTDDVRVPRMDEWLGKIQNEEKWAVELGELGLEKEIREFWKRVGGKEGEEEKARKADLAKKKGQKEKEKSGKQVEKGQKEKEKSDTQGEKGKRVGKGKTEQKTEVEKGKKEPKLTKRPKSSSHGSA